MKKAMLVGALLLWATAPLHAQVANTACVPALQPVPFFGPPNWYSNLAGTGNELINDPFDPRWSGAATQDLSFGANAHTSLRMGYDAATAPPAIDLQWTAWVDASGGHAASDGIWIAFADTQTLGATTHAGVLHLPLASTTTTATGAPAATVTPRYWYRLPGSSNWVERTGAGGTPNPPTWATTTARQWLPDSTAGNPYQWVISVRIPQGGGTVDNPDAGLTLPSPFFIAYELDAATAADGTSGMTPAVVPYGWPRTAGTVSATSVGVPSSSWPASLGSTTANTSSCQGISLGAGDLSTDYSGDDHAFSRNADNNLHAKPHNSTGADVAGITATFRVADWGSQIGTFNPGDTPWTTVGTSTAGTIPGGGTMQGDLTFLWQAGTTDYWTQMTGNPPAFTHIQHQCIYVELHSSTTNVLLSPDSAWTNMHFGPASKFEEDARISIKGLAALGAAPDRDVYLYFEKMNMNALSPPRKLPAPVTVTIPTQGTGTKPAPGKGETVTLQPSVPLSKLELANFATPSYRVHVFHDTGKTYTSADGKQHRVLEPQGDYGWFISHKGADAKTIWTADSALNPAPNQTTLTTPPTITKPWPEWWRLAIDNGGHITLTSTVTASDAAPPPPPPPPNHWILWIILIIAALVVLVVVWLVRRP